MKCYRARWIYPVTAPPLEDGLFLHDNEKIVAVGPYQELNVYGNQILDLGDVALLPGLVNAHTHLDLSGAEKSQWPQPGAPMTEWLTRVIDFRRSLNENDVQQALHQGIVQSIEAGVTLLGDIATTIDSVTLLQKAPLRSVVFREVLGVSSERAQARWQQWLDLEPITPNDRCRLGISPHAPYSVSEKWLTSLTLENQLVTCHLAESWQESQFLHDRSGEFAQFLLALGIQNWEELTTGYDNFLAHLPRGTGRLLIHGNYLPITLVAQAGDWLVHCPRTFDLFAHDQSPWQRLHPSWKDRILLATDSLASTPNLDPLAEAWTFGQKHPDVPPQRLLEMVTIKPARALGHHDICGSLDPGLSADCVVIPLLEQKAQPYGFFSPRNLSSPRQSMFRGTWR